MDLVELLRRWPLIRGLSDRLVAQFRLAESQGAGAVVDLFTAVYGMILCLFSILGLLISWPTDHLIAFTPGEVAVVTQWRILIMLCLAPLAIAFGVVRRRWMLVALYFVLVTCVMTISAYLFAPLGGLDRPYFSIIPAMPALTLAVMIPMFWHALLTVYMPLAYSGVYLWRNPTLLADSRWMVPVIWAGFAVLSTIAGGWIIRRLVYFVLHQRAVLGQQATQFRQQSEKLGRLSEQRADAITRLLIERNQVLENERARLARDLHDELGQRVAAMNIDVHLLRRKLEQPEEREVWQRLQDGLAGLIKRVREIVHQLRPQALEEGGFARAVEGLLQPLRDGTEIRFSTNLRGDSKAVRGPLAEDLFRIVTEAITNVVKHSGATEASVDFYFGEDGSVFGSIRDNGVGLSSQSQLSGLGLVSMGDRLKPYGGRMFVESTRNGFEVHLAVPPGRRTT